MQEYFSTFTEQVTASYPNILTALLILIVSVYLARLLGNLLKRVLLRRNTDVGVTDLLSDILRWTIVVFGIITALQRFFNVTAFLTGLGIIGFTVGFALQNVMQNFVSGIILLVQQPFKTGDEIHVTGYEGVILQINLRSTEIRTKDGRIVILPNADVISRPIVNYTRANRRRVDLPLWFSGHDNLEQVCTLVRAEFKEIPGYVQAPTPDVFFRKFDETSVELLAAFWVDTSVISTADAQAVLLSKIKTTFKKNRIKIQ